MWPHHLLTPGIRLMSHLCQKLPFWSYGYRCQLVPEPVHLAWGAGEGLPCSGREIWSNIHEGSSCNDSPPDLLHSDPSPLQMTTLSPQAHRPWQLNMGKATTFTWSRHKVSADTAFASITLGCGWQQEQVSLCGQSKVTKASMGIQQWKFGYPNFPF